MWRKIFLVITLVAATPTHAAPITIEMSGQTTGMTLRSVEPFVSNFRALTGLTSDAFDVVVRFDIEAANLRSDAPTTILPVQNVRFITPTLVGTSAASSPPYSILVLTDGQYDGGSQPDTALLNAAIATTDFGGGQFFIDLGIRNADSTLVQSPFDPATIANWSGQISPFISQVGAPVFAFFSSSSGFQYINRLSTGATFRVIDTTAIPEPANIALLGLGILVLGARRYRSRA
jgi:hypothetical protein